MDITETLAPKSDQLDAIDLATSGPQTYTITGVSKGNAEQPVQVSLAEFPRVWRPSKSMRRVLAAGWGTDASKFVGKRVTLFCDPSVMFGSERVGGVRISHMSDISKRLDVPLLVKRGKSATFSVEPLESEPAAPATRNLPTSEDIKACEDQETLRGWYQGADDDTKALILARKNELEGGAA